MANTIPFATAASIAHESKPWRSLELIGQSIAASRLQELVRRTSHLESGVLLVADPGADVESIARELHARGPASAAPFVTVECGASDAAAVEQTIFGIPSGAATSDLERVSSTSSAASARGGTLFLQDVVDLPAALQARLSRIARDREMQVDGEIVSTDFRLMASAPSSIDSDVRENRFRADLYRRLAASRIDLPPLRSRLEDVPSLACRVLEDLAGTTGSTVQSFAPASLALLSAMNWPGNLAELRAVVADLVRRTSTDVIQLEHVLPALQLQRSAPSFIPSGTLRDARLKFERDYISAVLQHHGWRMAEAAQALGIQRPNLYRKARQLGIPLNRTSE
jgi:DNA-binding NtrC family response regulator